MMSKLNATNNPTFTGIVTADIDVLMPIEIACHSHPWTKKTLLSCIGGRYFGEQLCPTGRTCIDSNIIGFYIGQYIAGEATLMDICVLPTEQGKGFGKILLTRFLTQAKERGAEKVFLEVRAKNIAAQMLYLNAGFIEINRRTGYYPSSSGFGYEDAIVMSLNC
jgi:ribosomal-protein-alanine N-acetyltransferase